MKPNPGGVITGKAIVDREIEINNIWNALQNQSVVLTSERRVGKTSVLRKMTEKPQDGWNPVLYIVEGKSHPIEFIEGLYEELIKEEIVKDKFHNLKKAYKKFCGGEQIGSWKLPNIQENWKTLLETTIEDLANSDKKVLLMFDELPLMISNFKKIKKDGLLVSMEFLDTLRAIRNKYEITKKIAFVFCGSIGLHLVIKDLKRNYGYNSDPINNMKIVTLDGMDKEGAKLLCDNLTEGEDYQFSNKEKIFDYICKRTDNLPFYIQHVFGFFYNNNIKLINEVNVNKAITYLLNDPKDEGFFDHYVDRIKTYYDKDYQDLSLFILDKACKKNDYWDEKNIINTIENENDEYKTEQIKEIIRLLWTDHYLIRQTNKRSYKFKYNILKEWWKINRG